MFKTYLELGIIHILDLAGLDHLLFLVALVITYSIKQWKPVLILATAFTLGHSITLALASMDIIKVNSKWIEILIAVSIAYTAAFNLYRPKSKGKDNLKYGSALIFGLIHGMGFSNFFKSILGKDDIVLPLFAFNVGVELAQVIIVLVVLILSFLITKILPKAKKPLVLGSSIIILIWSLKMVFERL